MEQSAVKENQPQNQEKKVCNETQECKEKKSTQVQKEKVKK